MALKTIVPKAVVTPILCSLHEIKQVYQDGEIQLFSDDLWWKKEVFIRFWKR